MFQIIHKARYLVYIIPIILLIAFLLFTHLYRNKLYILKVQEIERNNSLGNEIANSISRAFIEGNTQRSSEIINSLNRDGSILYGIFFNAQDSFLNGFMNPDIRRTGMSKIYDSKDNHSDFYKRYLKGVPKRFEDVLDILKIRIIKKMQDTQTEVGGVKLVFSLPFSRFERFLLKKSEMIYTLGILFLVFLVVLFAQDIRKESRRSYTSYMPRKEGVMGAIEAQIEEPSKKMPRKPEKPRQEEGVDLLSMEIDKSYKKTREYSDEELTEVEDGWVNLFNGWDLDEWQKRGNFYVSNNIIVGSPWQASVVRQDIDHKNYDFEFKARRITGSEGFVAIFKCGRKCHAWVLGGWGGSRSEVMRISETRSETRIEKGRWNEVRISVDKTVEGFLNGERIWSLPRKVLERNPSQTEFLPGIGLGVWSTMCKFKEVHYLKRS